MTTPTYYWNAKSNFGDRLTAPLLRHFADLHVKWAAPNMARLVCVGSNLDILPPQWSGVVAGAGKLHDRPVDLSKATVLGLRGRLTVPEIDDVVFGDAALLVDELVPRAEEEFWLGVVPHWSDDQLIHRFAHLHPHVIDPTGDPLEVVHEITRCRRIVASSLHGIVVADAYGIPRRAELFPESIRPWEGGAFKYLDYASGIEFPMEFGVMQCVPRPRIEAIQAELFDLFKQLPSVLS